MTNIKPIIYLMAKSAVKEHKAKEFSDVCEKVKTGIFSDMLIGKISKEEAKDLRDFVIEQERSVSDASLTA